MKSTFLRLACMIVATILTIPATASAKDLTSTELLLKERKLKKKYNISLERNGYFIAQQDFGKRLYGVFDGNLDWVIKPKYPYLTNVTSCGKALVGETPFKTRDFEGGWNRVGYTTSQILDVPSKTITGRFDYGFIFASAAWDFREDTIRVTKGAREAVGLYNICDGVQLTELNYRIIGGFSEQGFALAFTDTHYTILNRQGQEALPSPVPHGLPKDRFYKAYDDRVDVHDELNSEFWIMTGDNGKKGLFDLSTGGYKLPPDYDAIKSVEKRRAEVLYVLQKDNRYSVLSGDGQTIVVPDRFISEPIPYLAWATQWKGTIRTGSTGQMVNMYNTREKEFLLPFDNSTTDLEFVVHPVVKVTQRAKKGDAPVFGFWNQETKQWIVDPSQYQLVELAYSDDSEIIGQDADGNGFSFTADGTPIERSAAENAERASWARITKKIEEKIKSDYDEDAKVEVLQLEKDDKTYPLFAAVNSVGRKLWAFDAEQNLVLEADLVYGLEARVENGLFIILERENKRTTKRFTTCIDEGYQIVGSRFYCDPANPVSHGGSEAAEL